MTYDAVLSQKQVEKADPRSCEQMLLLFSLHPFDPETPPSFSIELSQTSKEK